MSQNGVAILGVFVADLAFRASRLPAIGETMIVSGFAVGPGGKGSNQAVAAARAGGRVSFISRIGKDTFGELALKIAFHPVESTHAALHVVDAEALQAHQ